MNDIYIWKINGCEFELDMEDAETAERYLTAIELLNKNKTSDTSNIVERIRVYCKIFRKFYDELLGNGSSEKIFAGVKDNMRKYDEVFNSLLDFIYTQRSESSGRMNELARRYAPKRVKPNDKSAF